MPALDPDLIASRYKLEVARSNARTVRVLCLFHLEKTASLALSWAEEAKARIPQGKVTLTPSGWVFALHGQAFTREDPFGFTLHQDE